MMKLKGQTISLRAIETSDINVLYQWENDTEIWNVSNTLTPFSHFVLEQYIVNAHEDIYTAKQLRLIIDINPDMRESNPSSSNEGMEQEKLSGLKNKSIGCIDLFDFEPNHQRAGVGILIADKSYRKKGFASEALEILIEYCFQTLNLKQLYCNITTDNESSLLLFQKHGFEISGIKKQWIRHGAEFRDELFLQLIRK